MIFIWTKIVIRGSSNFASTFDKIQWCCTIQEQTRGMNQYEDAILPV